MVAVKAQYRPSRSDYDWRAAKTPSKPAVKSFAGFIFVCDESTRRDLGRMVFGLPASYMDKVRAIRTGMPLFLFNFSERLLYGVFEAASDGGFNIDPYAWEDLDGKLGRYSKPVSKFPAQVRICVRTERHALDEELFRSILDYEDNVFKLDLNSHQVQQLIQLFDSSVPIERNIENQNSSVVHSRDPESPRAGYKSDSYCSSDCSSKSLNSCEDEWNDDVNENLHHQQEDDQDVLNERLNRIDIEQPEQNDEHCQMSNASNASEGSHYYSLQCKENSQKREYTDSMLRRFHEDDPAVNSNSCLQTRGDQSMTVNRQDGVVAMPVVPSQIPFYMDNMVAKCQREENPNFATHTHKATKWSEQKYSRGSSGHLRSQGFVQDKITMSTNHSQQMPIENRPGQLSVSMRQNLEGLTFTKTTDDIQREKNPHFIQNAPIVFVPSIIHRPSQGRNLVEDLHFEILNFARCTRPSRQVQYHVEAAISCVRKGVKSVWPEADVEVFGSFSTGLCLQHSDVDLAVIDAPLLENLTITQASSILVRKLAAVLSTYEWCESINPLDTASMPVLKCLCRPFGTSNSPSIAVDITIGSINRVLPAVQEPRKFSSRHTGGAARDYVLQKIREFPALAPLVLLLKSFLHHKDLSNVYSGGLGSFSLTLLVAFFLERIHVPRDICSDRGNSDSPTSLLKSSPLSCSSEFSDDSDTPCTSGRFGTLSSTEFSDYSHDFGERYVRRAADTIEGVLAHWGHCSSPCLGSLLIGFLHSFGVALDLSRVKIVLNGIDGSPGGICEREDPHIALWIDDPLRPGVNIGAGSYGMARVRAAFKEMRDVLYTPSMLASPLRCEDEHCQDLVSFAELPNLRQLMNKADGY